MEWVFKLQLEHIRKFSPKNTYKIYAAIIKCFASIETQLRTANDVIICDVIADHKNPSKQHSMALTQLMNAALSDGREEIFTLDVDSFPIQKNWMNLMVTKAKKNSGVCAVHRIENGDVFLPHPCGALILASFVHKYPFEFFPENIESAGSEFLSETNQRADSGIGLALSLSLWKNKQPWSELPRSNHLNMHYLIAGVYGDVIFHLGAGSREPIFSKEIKTNSLMKATSPLKKTPVLWHLHSLIEKGVEMYYTRKNRQIINNVQRELVRNSEVFINTLRCQTT
jgi:hypothetical protein